MRIPRFVGSRWRSQDGERLNSTARHRLLMLMFGAVGAVMVEAGFLLAGSGGLGGVLAGVLMPSGGGLIVWAVMEARGRDLRLTGEIEQAAEFDIIHMRLDDLARANGQEPYWDLLPELRAHQASRVAHLSGLDELTRDE